MSASRKLGLLGALVLAACLTLLVAPTAASAGAGATTPAAPAVGEQLLGLDAVTFQESGLPATTSWSVTLGGSSSSALAPLPNAFVVSNGVYAYAIGKVTGYSASPSSGKLNVSSAVVGVKIVFTAGSPSSTYPVSFTEKGLASGVSWSVTVNGTVDSAKAPSSIEFNLTDGTHAFSVGAVGGYAASPTAGNVTVSGAPVTAPISFGADIQHAVVIVLENYEYSTVLANGPYQKYLWNHYGQASNFYGSCHQSLPEYTAMTSGRSFTCASLAVSSVQNLGDLVDHHGLSWAGYFESMPSACDSTSSYPYTVYHNPFLLYSDIVNNATRCDSHIVNSAAFNSSVRNGSLPTVSFYIPNDINDCHDTTVASCDAWLKSFLVPILNSTSPAEQQQVAHTAFFLLYDEGGTNAGYSVGGIVNSWCQNTTHQALSVCGGHVWMTVVSPYSVGTSYRANATDYNLESTIEWLFGLGNDGGYDGSQYFPSMSSLFTFTANGKVSPLAEPASPPGAGATAGAPPFLLSVLTVGPISLAGLGVVVGAWLRRARRTRSLPIGRE